MSTWHSSDSYELKSLRLLQTDFPVVEHVDADLALVQIKSRYVALSRYADTIASSITTEKLQRFDVFAHEFLFNGIISSAGEFRTQVDARQGEVYFGGVRDVSARYKGIAPTKITTERVKIFELLQQNDRPLYRAIKFYQQYVYMHPFHDGNGRVGRLIVDIYLRKHGLLIQWSMIRKNHKWLNRLNKCHDVQYGDSVIYEKRLRYLVSHFEKATLEIKSLLEE